MQATQVAHLSGGAGAEAIVDPAARGRPCACCRRSNNVVLENELMDAGEVRRAFELNTAIVKAFNRMTMLVSKG